MDIYCRHCGNPWEEVGLHDLEEYTGVATPHRDAVELFRKLGCNAFNGNQWKCDLDPIEDRQVLEIIGDCQDSTPYPEEWLSPDDIMYMVGNLKEFF